MLFIADFFVEDIAGGGELCSEELLNYLQKFQDNLIVKKRSHTVTERDLKGLGGDLVIVSNFINLSSAIKTIMIADNINYVIIEHDWKMIKSRNPLAYIGLLAPESELINLGFFRNAKAVFCQSKSHAEIIQKNLWSDNIVNLGCNLWSDKDIESMTKRHFSNSLQANTRKFGIMNSPNKIKGTKEAIELCRSNGIEYELINHCDQEKFFDELYKTEKIIFLPQSFETYSRFVMEAKMLNCKLITNKAIGAMSEDYFHLNGLELIEEIKKRKEEVLNRIQKFILTGQIDFIPPLKKPKISLITTVYKGSKFMAGFLDAFVAQVYSGDTELIIIDANSPENEREITEPYLQKHSNIKYIRLNEKKTTMESFNIATDLASGEFIALCMIDDRLSPEHFNVLSKHLVLDTTVDLVYGDTIVSNLPNEKFAEDETRSVFDHSKYPFSKENMIKNIAGPMPMYRKSLHYKIGGYKNKILHAGDWEFYLNAVKNGALFKKINKRIGIYFLNPDGLSTTADAVITKERRSQEKQIFEEYKDVFGDKVYQHFKQYFDQF